VTELARDLGKPVQLAIAGGDVLLDRRVLEALVDPLQHMLRNAVDHGIEPAGERARLGKPREGRLRIEIAPSGDRVELSVEDDGRGLDAAELKRVAVARGVIDAAAAAKLPDREILMLVTLPGFTTATAVTHVSGRGVGLDVVRSAVERLGGLVQIESRPGLGTCLRLCVPASLTLLQALVVRCAGELFALPLPVVERVLGRGDLREPLASAEVVFPLASRLGLGPRDDDIRGCSIVLRAAGRRIGVVVDEVLGRREIVLRPLQPPLSLLRHYAGAAVLEDGSIVLALDPAHL
jgi:two-component system chemotaxis sensor kinase CheA